MYNRWIFLNTDTFLEEFYATKELAMVGWGFPVVRFLVFIFWPGFCAKLILSSNLYTSVMCDYVRVLEFGIHCL